MSRFLLWTEHVGRLRRAAESFEQTPAILLRANFLDPDSAGV